MNHKSWFGKCVGVCVALTEPLDIVKISIQVRCRLRTERKTAAVKLGQEIEMERERERENGYLPISTILETELLMFMKTPFWIIS